MALDPYACVNTTDYLHPRDPNLCRLENTLQYNIDGQPVMRTHVDGITLQGDVIVDKVKLIIDSVGNTLNETNSARVTVTNGTITVEGTVNIGTIPEVEIKNDLNNPISISKNNSANSDTNPLYVKGTSDTSFFSPTQTDAFGRLRVSSPFPLFDSFHRFHDNGKVNEYTSGTASSSHDANSSTVVMSIGNTLGDKIYRESNRVFAYQPGKSLLILQTFCMNAGKDGLRQRQGYFNNQSGVFIELNGTTLNFVRRTSVSGTLQEYRVPQTEWNIDTMISNNPKNPSGITLDITRVQIYWMDIEWLGVGSIRMGFVVKGEFIHCHTFHHANEASILPHTDTTLPYMQTACLPVRAELENVSSTSGSSIYRLICTSIMSEGGYTLTGRPQSLGHPLANPYNVSAGKIYPIFTMRLKSTRMDSIVIPRTFSIAVAGNTNFKWYIIEGAISVNGTWVNAGLTSSVEYNLTATSTSGGTVLDNGYIINSNQSSSTLSNVETPFKYQLKRNSFTSTATEFSICIETTGSNISVWASVNWEEVT